MSTPTENPATEAQEDAPKTVPQQKKKDSVVMHTGLDYFADEEKEKRRKRAERFGIPEFSFEAKREGLTPAQLAAVQEQKKTFSVVEKELNMPLSEAGDDREEANLAYELRRNVIHLYGSVFVNRNALTKDVLKYFELYGPRKIEWISSLRCNVVFADTFAAQRALLGLSRSLVSSVNAVTEQLEKWDELTSTESKDGENEGDKMKLEKPRTDELELLAWRVALDSGKDATLFMRTANVKDKKRTYKDGAKRTEAEKRRYGIYLNKLSNKGELIRQRLAKDRVPKISLSALRAKRKQPDDVYDNDDVYAEQDTVKIDYTAYQLDVEDDDSAKKDEDANNPNIKKRKFV